MRTPQGVGWTGRANRSTFICGSTAQDGERWCHDVAHNMATGKIEADQCDNCSIKQWQFIAGSPMPSSSTSTTTLPTPSVCSGKIYTIKSGDTYQSVSKSQDVGTAQLLVDNGLEAYCKDFLSQETAIPAPVPTNLANGTVKRCSQYYLVEPENYCNNAILKYSISLNNFLFLNKGVNKNCTNLFANESYCVSPLDSINDYPGAPGYTDPSASYSDIPYSSYPTAAYTPPINANVTKLLPISPGNRKDCHIYIASPELQIDVSGTFYASSCEAVAEAAGKAVEELEQWNSSISANGTCTFSPSYRYCMNPNRPTDSGPVATKPPVPSSSTSTASHTTISSVSTTITATKTAPTTGGPPGPTQSGIPDNCNKWHLVTSSDENCATVAAKYNISLKQFYNWNPAVSHDCVDGFWKDEAYCVGVAK
ncbi:hypothetical protein N8T08_004914 [Aspergillus melleus]|uniref:Uncharacterized protein n=1 Tax=Aspergillus melleus TaxID=138277 RepID=A0ACC3B2L0_9EURO|nr:hypothetical protein N8T08_004914 [Aspergillus melleus]